MACSAFTYVSQSGALHRTVRMPPYGALNVPSTTDLLD